MKKKMTQARNVAAIVLFASLAACGGGGGGTSSTATVTGNVAVAPADGLGTDGHLPGTATIAGSSLPSAAVDLGALQVAVGLSNEGRALAVWQVLGAELKADRVAAWAQSTTGDVWSAGSLLPQAGNASGLFKLTMRMNAAGNAVLGWIDAGSGGAATDTSGPRVARFIQGSGWDPVSYDPMAGFGPARLATAGASWDLSMLADDSFTYSGRTTDSVSVIQTSPGGQQTRALETGQESGSVSEFSYFAPRGNGDGLLYTSTLGPVKTYQTYDVSARFAAVGMGMLGAIPLGNFGALCTHPNYEYPVVAATTPGDEGVLALTTVDSGGCTTNKLELIRLYTQSAIRVEKARLNSALTYLPAAPAVVLDKAGNALAVWIESSGDPARGQDSDTVRMMWSQSLYGAAWSTPQELVGNAAGLSLAYLRRNPISLAMNAEGQAVAALLLGSLDPTIAVSRFDFKSGWTAWKPVANKKELSRPAVAINASGQAVVAYAGIDMPRVDGKAPNPYHPKYMRVFALRF